MRDSQRERVRAALVLMLGPETSDMTRQRAQRRLLRRGVDILPIVLDTLNSYPEITAPEWPDWPPQYRFCARLLLRLSRGAHLSLEDLLRHPPLPPQCGPVLWTAVIEATRYQPAVDHEELLREGLATPWATVRYAAAMNLAERDRKKLLHRETVQALRSHLEEPEALPVRLAVSYTLLQRGEEQALAVVEGFLAPTYPTEISRAAAFVLSTLPPSRFSPERLQATMATLVDMLHDEDAALASQAARTLGKIAPVTILPLLGRILAEHHPRTGWAVLQTLDEMARQRSICQEMRWQGIYTQIVPYCSAEESEVRLQACHVLAACGGEYATAILATVFQDREHPGHLEAIESLRVLHGVLRPPLRQRVVRWLLSMLSDSSEATQATALDTLANLLWKARRYQKQAWQQMCTQIVQEGNLARLLGSESAWVRQRAIELLIPLGSARDALAGLRPTLAHLLSADDDSGVRACVAYTYGQIAATWAIPDLILALLDANEYVAQTALHALEQLATPDDIIVVSVMRELARLEDLADERMRKLAREARQLLRKWRRRRKPGVARFESGHYTMQK